MPIFGASRSEENLYTSITGEELLAIIREMGFVPELSKDSEGDPVVRFQIEGLKTSILFYEGKEGRYESLQFFAGFSDKVPLQKTNEWCRKKRYSRVYLDANDTINIEWDVTLAGGVRKEYIIEAVRRWRRIFLSVCEFFAS
jgi:hypothetical protein